MPAVARPLRGESIPGGGHEVDGQRFIVDAADPEAVSRAFAGVRLTELRASARRLEDVYAKRFAQIGSPSCGCPPHEPRPMTGCLPCGHTRVSRRGGPPPPPPPGPPPARQTPTP